MQAGRAPDGRPLPLCPQMSDSTRRAFDLLSDLAIRAASDDDTIRELASLGEPAIPALEEATGLDDDRVRRVAIRALASIPCRRAIAPLLNICDTERKRDPELATIALRGAIPALAPRHAERLHDFLVEISGHVDPFLRAAAADAFAAVQDPRATHTLLDLTSDSDEFVAERAAVALKAAGSRPTDDDGRFCASDIDLLAGLASRHGSTRLAAIRRVTASGDAVEFIRRHLGEPHAIIRRSVLEAAGQIRAPALFEPLAAIIDDSATRDHERALAILGLAVGPEVDEPDAIGLVRRHRRSADPFVRAAAAGFAVRTGLAAAMDEVSDALADRSAHVRATVARAFAESDPLSVVPLVPTAVDALKEILPRARPNPDDAEVAVSLLRGLRRVAEAGGFVEAGVSSVLARGLRSSDQAVQIASARAFDVVVEDDALPDDLTVDVARALLDSEVDARIDRGLGLLERLPGSLDEAVPALIKLIYRSDSERVSRIARVLHRSRLPAAEGALARLAKHADSKVRATAGHSPDDPPLILQEPPSTFRPPPRARPGGPRRTADTPAATEDEP